MPNVIENNKFERVIAELSTGDPTKWSLPSTFGGLYTLDPTKTRESVKEMVSYAITGDEPGIYTGTSALKTSRVKRISVTGSYSEFKIKMLLTKEQVLHKESAPEEYIAERLTLFGGSIQGLKMFKQDLYVTGESVQKYYEEGFDQSPESALIDYRENSLLGNTKFTDYADFNANALDPMVVFEKFAAMISESRKLSGSIPNTIVIGPNFHNKLSSLEFAALGVGKNLLTGIENLLGDGGRIVKFDPFDKRDIVTGDYTESYILIYNDMIKPFIIQDGYEPRDWQANGNPNVFLQEGGASGNESEYGFLKTVIGPIYFNPNTAKSVIRSKLIL